MKATKFEDMHSGGGAKEKWETIVIEAPQTEAEVIFQNRFGHNPNRVTCTCCGSDYSIQEYDSKELAMQDAWEHHNRRFLLTNEEILPEWKVGELHEQGYIWHE